MPVARESAASCSDTVMTLSRPRSASASSRVDAAVFGLSCPGDANRVQPVFLDSGDHVVKRVEINRVAADGGALGRRALDQHPSDVCRRHRQTEYEVHLVCPRSDQSAPRLPPDPDTQKPSVNRARLRVLPLGCSRASDGSSQHDVDVRDRPLGRRDPPPEARANPADRASPPAAPPDAAGAYIFQDEFDGPNGAGPNPANWTVQSWQDDVFPPVVGIYRDDRRNVFLDGNSNLVLLATHE